MINDNEYYELINYFNNLSSDEKDKYISSFLKKRKNLSDVKKIYKCYLELLKRVKNEEITKEEKSVYEFISSYLIFFNKFKNNKAFNIYSHKYLNNLGKDNLFIKNTLIVQDIINLLNEKYNLNVTLKHEYMNRSVGSIDVLNDKDEIEINRYFYNLFLNDEDEYYSVASLIFVLSHEYKHLIQKSKYFNSEVDNQKYYNELFLMAGAPFFYRKYHNYFSTEMEANEFAFNNVNELMKKYFPELKKSDLYYIIERLYEKYAFTNSDTYQIFLEKRDKKLNTFDKIKYKPRAIKKLELKKKSTMN